MYSRITTRVTALYNPQPDIQWMCPLLKDATCLTCASRYVHKHYCSRSLVNNVCMRLAVSTTNTHGVRASYTPKRSVSDWSSTTSGDGGGKWPSLTPRVPLGGAYRSSHWTCVRGGDISTRRSLIGALPLGETTPVVFDTPPRTGQGMSCETILFMGLHRSEQIPPQRNKNTNWIYWIQGVCLNETLASFVFWFGRMMHRFLHGNPLYTFRCLGLIVWLSVQCLRGLF